ncbi:MAG: hypothetical protein MPW15_23145 [Candidatus Manganitrophus sp.]|nr:hypothetical protein [Candidatus Manganitrophus sp.]
MNGNTASLTAIWDDRPRLNALRPQRLAEHARRAHLGQRQAGRLGHEGHRARGARVHLEQVDLAVLDGELDVHQADDAELVRQDASSARAFVSNIDGLKE